MSATRSFSPIAEASARILVLGSMPGVRSLRAQQYYAHPRNAFWRIMAEIFGFNPDCDYERRLAHLTAARIALWDVLEACVRVGSLDSAIEVGSRVPNDFATFLADHPGIRLICFNGGEAKRSFDRYVLPKLAADHLRYALLPSTSPAHTLAFKNKMRVWREALAG